MNASGISPMSSSPLEDLAALGPKQPRSLSQYLVPMFDVATTAARNRPISASRFARYNRTNPMRKGRRSADHDESAQPIKILLHEIAAHLGDVGVGQALGDRTRGAAVADLGAVEAAHAGDAEARGSQEHLFGVRRVEEIDVAFNCWNGELAREIERHLAADAGKDVTFARGIERAHADHKDVADNQIGEI